jgi:hypothetical protein
MDFTRATTSKFSHYAKTCIRNTKPSTQQRKPPRRPPTTNPLKKPKTAIQFPKQILTDDNQTQTTITQTSEDNEAILDVQHDLQEHAIKISIQDTRIAPLEQHYRDLLHLKELSDWIIALESGYHDHSTVINKFHKEIEGITKTTSLVSSSIQQQQQQLQNQWQTITDNDSNNNTKFKSITDDHQRFQTTLISHKNNIQNHHDQTESTKTKYKSLKTKVKQQQYQIDDLYSSFLSQYNNPNRPTPDAPKRKWRKSKTSPNTSTTMAPDITSNQQMNNHDSDDNNLATTTIYSTNSIPQIMASDTVNISIEENNTSNSDISNYNNRRVDRNDQPMIEQTSREDNANKQYDSDETLRALTTTQTNVHSKIETWLL